MTSVIASQGQPLDHSTPALSLLIHPSTGLPDFSLIPRAAGRHSQAAFFRVSARTINHHALSSHQFPLPDLDAARIHAASRYGSYALLTAFTILPMTHLTPPQLTFLIRDRLGLHQSDFSFLSLSTCHPRCRTFPLPLAAAADPPAGAGAAALGAVPASDGFATTSDSASPSGAPAADILTPQKPRLRV